MASLEGCLLRGTNVIITTDQSVFTAQLNVSKSKFGHPTGIIIENCCQYGLEPRWVDDLISLIALIDLRNTVPMCWPEGV
jgi:hypothetical protein